MKYDVDGRLYLYLERNKSGKIDSFIKLVGQDKLFRYDGITKERAFTKYDCECSIAHRFEASESWVTVIKKGCDITNQYDFPRKKSSFSFDKNRFATLFTISTNLVCKCTEVLKVTYSDKRVYPHIRISPSLSNSKLFMNTIIAKIAKNAKEHIRFTEND